MDVELLKLIISASSETLELLFIERGATVQYCSRSPLPDPYRRCGGMSSLELS